jgi:hypothetical protein
VVSLVSIEAAKRHLRVTTTHEDDDILLKLELASEEILGYLRGNTSIDELVMDAWAEGSLDIPAPVIVAVLNRLTFLYEHRGDDPGRDEECWESIAKNLVRLRTPGMSVGISTT